MEHTRADEPSRDENQDEHEPRIKDETIKCAELCVLTFEHACVGMRVDERVLVLECMEELLHVLGTFWCNNLGEHCTTSHWLDQFLHLLLGEPLILQSYVVRVLSDSVHHVSEASRSHMEAELDNVQGDKLREVRTLVLGRHRDHVIHDLL